MQKDVTDAELAATRLGYDKALALWMYEGQLTWTRFTAMLTANIININVIAFMRSTGGIYVYVLGTVGILLCLAWFLLMQRAFCYCKYWIYCAREYEGRLTGVMSVTRGADYAAGKEVVFEFQGEKQPLQMSSWVKMVKVEWIANTVTILFLLAYSVAMVVMR